MVTVNLLNQQTRLVCLALSPHPENFMMTFFNNNFIFRRSETMSQRLRKSIRGKLRPSIFTVNRYSSVFKENYLRYATLS